MQRVVILVLAGCWTTAPSTMPEAPIVVRPGEKCLVTARDVDTPNAAQLAHGGHVFAKVLSTFQRFDVRFDRDTAIAHLETEELELESELVLDDMPIRPTSDQPLGGWLRIDAARAREATGAQLRIDVTLPRGLEPPIHRTSLDCGALTFAAPIERVELPDDLEWVAFAPGSRSALSTTPNGASVATIAAPSSAKAEPIIARVIERRPAAQAIRIELANESSIVTGWVATKSTSDSPPADLTGFGFGRSGWSRSTVSCSKSVPIYVPDNVRVGRFKPDAIITIEDEQDGQIEVDLGVENGIAYIKSRDVRDCR